MMPVKLLDVTCWWPCPNCINKINSRIAAPEATLSRGTASMKMNEKRAIHLSYPLQCTFPRYRAHSKPTDFVVEVYFCAQCFTLFLNAPSRGVIFVIMNFVALDNVEYCEATATSDNLLSFKKTHINLQRFQKFCKAVKVLQSLQHRWMAWKGRNMGRNVQVFNKERAAK